MNAARLVMLLSGAQPTLNLDFSGGVADSRITFGGTGGTVTNSSGSLVVSSGPRLSFNTATSKYALMIEPAATNLLLNSLVNGTNLSTQSVTVTAQAYTLSFYGTGTVTLSGSATGAKVGTGAYPTRSTFTFTPTAGTLTLTVSGTVQFAQLEAGLLATSFVPTAGTSATRTVDSAAMTGAAFSWFNANQGTFVVDFSTSFTGNATTGLGIISSGLNARYAYIGSTTAVAATNDGTTIASASAVVTDAALHKCASSYSANTSRVLVVDGGSPVSATCAAAYTAGTAFYIGALGASGTNPFIGLISRIRYWQTQLSPGQLQRLTQ
jgi:hypothetical protein